MDGKTQVREATSVGIGFRNSFSLEKQDSLEELFQQPLPNSSQNISFLLKMNRGGSLLETKKDSTHQNFTFPVPLKLKAVNLPTENQ